MVIKASSGPVSGKKPAVPGFLPPPPGDGKFSRQKKQKNFTKALAVFFRSEYITATDAADMIRDTRRAISSVGRAPRLHRGCREFESLIAHHFPRRFKYHPSNRDPSCLLSRCDKPSNIRNYRPLPLLRSVKRRHDSQPLESLFSSYTMPNRHCCSIFRQLDHPLYQPATYRKIRKIQTF